MRSDLGADIWSLVSALKEKTLMPTVSPISSGATTNCIPVITGKLASRTAANCSVRRHGGGIGRMASRSTNINATATSR